MKLHGADCDKINIESWLTADKRFPGLEIKPVDSNLKLRSDIEEWIEELNNDNPGAAFIYMQGHGLPEYMGSYVTGDSFAAGQGPTVIRSEEWINMFSKFDRRAQFITITDFCHSGNFFRLQYKLEPKQDGEGAQWIETEEWAQGYGAGSIRLSSPMLHLAGSARNENVFETGRTGGYFTHVLSETGIKTLPELLKRLRAGVDKHLEKARCYDKNPIPANVTQTPQVCSFPTPLKF
ncbi:unnamed protein product [Rhizoctonia solani]|nr:unnamed protein product [Rhizoctonia solani]